MGWQNNIFPLLIIDASGAFTGLFVYSPGPGAGNLIASIAASSGTDPYGNAYQKGIASYAASGAVTVINGATTLVYSGAPAAGNLLASIAPAAGTDGFGNAYVTGTGSYASSGAVTAVNGAVTTVYSGTPAGGTSDNLVASIAPANTTDSAGNTVQAGLAVYQTQLGVGLRETIQLIGSIIQWINATSSDKLVLAQNTVTNNLFIQAGGAATASATIEISNPNSLTIPETWHSLSAGNNWTGTVFYRLYPMNAVQIYAVLTSPAAAVNNVTIVTLPAGYRPASITTQWNATHTAAANFEEQFNLGTSGALQSTGVGTNAQVVINESVPLDVP